jgi:putative transposase
MPSKETSPMNERVKFVAAMLEAEESFSDLCACFGISRKQGYKWKQRYELGGVAALVDGSRAPHSHPHASSEVVQLLVAARKKHPLWVHESLVVVRRQHPRVTLRSASTVGASFKKRGLAGKPRRVRRSDPYKDRLGPYDGPNRVWCAHFKGNCRPWRALQPAHDQRWLYSLPADVQGASEHDLRARDARLRS